MSLISAVLFVLFTTNLSAQELAPGQGQGQEEQAYFGPTLLSRPQSASNRVATPLAFRPYLRVNGIYDTGLVNVSIDPNGNVPNVAAAGVEGSIGAYLFHTTKKTAVSLDYKGDFRHYTRSTYYDGSDHFLTFGVTHQPARHIVFSVRESAGTFSRNFGLVNPVGVFDTTVNQAPTNEIFDNRVNYFTTQGDMTWLKSARMSFNIGGDGFLVRRQSTALYGVSGADARADVAYRLTRRVTVGADYRYLHYSFTRAFGGSDAQGAGINLAWRISRGWELALRAGGFRVETESVETVEIDPLVAAIIGQSSGVAAFHQVSYIPSMSGRLSRSFRHARLDFRYSRDIIPGNGLYLTSRADSADTAFSFTGRRRWNIGVNGNYSNMKSLTRLQGTYRGYSGGAGVTRVIGRNIHGVARFDVRRYDTSFAALNRLIYRGSLGFAYSPGILPLSLW